MKKQAKNFIVKKSLRPVPNQGKVEQAKNMVASDPSEVTQETPEDPESEVAEDRLMKDIIK